MKESKKQTNEHIDATVKTKPCAISVIAMVVTRTSRKVNGISMKYPGEKHQNGGEKKLKKERENERIGACSNALKLN